MKPIVFEGSLTIERVSEMQEQLRSALVGHSGLSLMTLDLAEVREFDGAGLQLLLCLARVTERMGMQLALANPSQAIENVLRQYDVLKRFASKEPV